MAGVYSEEDILGDVEVVFDEELGGALDHKVGGR